MFSSTKAAPGASRSAQPLPSSIAPSPNRRISPLGKDHGGHRARPPPPPPPAARVKQGSNTARALPKAERERSARFPPLREGSAPSSAARHRASPEQPARKGLRAQRCLLLLFFLLRVPAAHAQNGKDGRDVSHRTAGTAGRRTRSGAGGCADSLESEEQSAGGQDETECEGEDSAVPRQHQPAAAIEAVAAREHLPFPSGPPILAWTLRYNGRRGNGGARSGGTGRDLPVLAVLHGAARSPQRPARPRPALQRPLPATVGSGV